MPNRIIKESICTSEEIDSLTPEQEVFFYRLMVNCDDYGLFDGRAKIIASKCYPLKSVDIKLIQEMLSALIQVGLISMYEVDGKPYLTISKWADHQQIRAKRAKYPMPSDGRLIVDDINRNQVIADAPVNQSNPIQSESFPPSGGDDILKDLFSGAKNLGIKPSLIGKAIKEVGEIETMAALEMANGQESPTNAFAASIRNRKARIEAAGDAAEMLKPRRFDPSVLSI